MSLALSLPENAVRAPSWPLADVAERQEPNALNEQTLLLWRAFSPLPIELRRWALTRGRVEAGGAGSRILVRNEVAVVISGALSSQVAGSALTADILGPGNVFGAGSCREVSGEWITDGLIYQVPLSDWMETAGAGGLAHLLDASDRGRERLEKGLACASVHLATQRVAEMLIALYQATGLTAVPLSQERLGQMLGLRRTTVNASCRALQCAGLIRTLRGRTRLLNVEALRQAACGCRRVVDFETSAVKLAS